MTRTTEERLERRARQAAEGEIAMREYRAAEEARRRNTDKLREARLRREEMQTSAPAPRQKAKADSARLEGKA